MTPNPGPCSHGRARFTGPNRNGIAHDVGPLFFPQTRALGIDCGSYSWDVARMIVYAGTSHPSFSHGSEALAQLAGLSISEKPVERFTKRIGQERVAERDWDVAAFLALPLMEKVASPLAEPVDLAVVQMGGGRLQILERGGSTTAPPDTEAMGSESSTEDAALPGHRREDKIGVVAQ